MEREILSQRKKNLAHCNEALCCHFFNTTLKKKPNFQWYLIVFAGTNTSTKLEGKNDLNSSAKLSHSQDF